MRFTINLATRTYLDHRLLNRGASCVIAVLLVIAGWNVIRVSSNIGEQSRIKTQIAAIQSRLGNNSGTVPAPESGRQKASIRFYNEIIERKSVNWLNLLEKFESVTPAGISLSSLSMDKKLGEWKLEGSARSFKVVRQYLERLETSDDFSNILLISHHNLTSGENMRGIQFTISCKVLNL